MVFSEFCVIFFDFRGIFRLLWYFSSLVVFFSRFIYLRAEKRTLAAEAALDGDMEYQPKRVMVTK